VYPGLAQAELPVDRKPNFFSIFIVLPVVLPPANRAEAKRTGDVERLVSTARTAIAILSGHPVGLTEPREEQITSPALKESEHQVICRRAATNRSAPVLLRLDVQTGFRVRDILVPGLVLPAFGTSERRSA
jgi:hypothetical protein